MKKEHLAYRVFFEGSIPVDFWKRILEFSEELLGQTQSGRIERFANAYGEGKKSKVRDLKLSKLNLEKYEEDASYNEIGRLSFYKLSANWIYKALDMDFSFEFEQDPNFTKMKSIVLHFDMPVDNNSGKFKAQNLLKKLLVWLSSKRFKINYACILIMDKAKGPGFFINGVGNRALTKYESQVCQKWFSFQDKSDHKVIDLFWATVLNEQHIMGYFSQLEIEEYFIEETFGNQKLYTLLLPMPWHEFNSEVFENDPYINKIRSIFKEKGIFYDQKTAYISS